MQDTSELKIIGFGQRHNHGHLLVPGFEHPTSGCVLACIDSVNSVVELDVGQIEIVLLTQQLRL